MNPWVIGAWAIFAAASAAAHDDELLKELKARTDKDQTARNALIAFEQRTGFSTPTPGAKDPALAKEFEDLVKKCSAVDAENTAWLRVVIGKHGWLGRTLVGKEGAHLAWLLVQHADHDRAFQKSCLKLMTKMPKGEVDGKELAYLTDRVAVGEGKKQVYGTQLQQKDGKLVPHPIEDAEHVDQRRAELGMGTLKEYIAACAKVYQAAPAEKPGGNSK